jgi:hypothetical protein
MLALLPACSGCRKKGSAADAGAGAASGEAPGPPVPLPTFERFINARSRDDGDIDVAGVTRGNDLVIARVSTSSEGDAGAAVIGRKVDVLSHRFEATEDTMISLAPGGIVVVVGRIAGKSGVFLTSATFEPREITEEWCQVAGGVAWLAREPGGGRVFQVQAGAADVSSGLVGAAPDHEMNLECGGEVALVSVRDGEDFSLARLRPRDASFSAPPTLVELEREGELEDELRERYVVPRSGASGDVVVVRVGERKVAMRTLATGAAAPSEWSILASTKESGEAGKDFRLHPDAVIVDVVSDGAGVAWLLASEPTPGAKACKGDDEPPRRIVLHSLAMGNAGDKGSEHGKPIVELPCDVEAIGAHLTAGANGARLWWTEPVADGSCAFPGLAVGAVVEATSDKPGARRIGMLAEGVARAADGRWIRVVRAGGCAPYAAAGNGALEWTAP